MNDLILFSFFTAALIVGAVLYFSYFTLTKEATGYKKYTTIQQYFKNNQQILHPNVISSWRKKCGWICAIFLGLSLYYHVIILQCVLLSLCLLNSYGNTLKNRRYQKKYDKSPKPRFFEVFLLLFTFLVSFEQHQNWHALF